MKNKMFIAWVAVFVAWMAGSFVVHGALLFADYGRLPNLFRSEADSEQYFPLMLVAHVIMAGAFVWIYSRGIAPTPWLGQGLRYGLAVALLGVVPTYIIYYAVQPLPGDLVVKQIILDGILVVLLGCLVAFLYRGAERRI